jgi:hypothetical protein
MVTLQRRTVVYMPLKVCTGAFSIGCLSSLMPVEAVADSKLREVSAVAAG